MPDSKLPAVPETILKRRKRQAENRANRAKEAIKLKVARKHKRAEIFKRAEKYAKEYQDQERDEIRSEPFPKVHFDILGPPGKYFLSDLNVSYIIKYTYLESGSNSALNIKLFNSSKSNHVSNPLI